MRGVTPQGRTALQPRAFQPALPMRGVTDQGATRITAGSFQPALPMRGVTGLHDQVGRRRGISTRTPHAGSDRMHLLLVGRHDDFNPHSPCGE